MATIDIRNTNSEKIENIRFSDDDPKYANPTSLEKSSLFPLVYLSDEADINVLTITSEEEAFNLIIGIQKAIELGWFN